jgi:hypothetical protein
MASLSSGIYVDLSSFENVKAFVKRDTPPVIYRSLQGGGVGWIGYIDRKRRSCTKTVSYHGRWMRRDIYPQPGSS